MELKLVRIYKKEGYTIGKLYINNVYFCDTLEDTDRGLRSDMSIIELKSLKIPGKTAIPTGKYIIDISIVSPRFSQKAVYKKIQGKLPRLLDVPAYEGCLMHIGNNEEHTDGCILVGQNKVKGQVINSTDTFFSLYNELSKASKRGEIITIEII